MSRRLVVVGAGCATAALIVWLLFVLLPRWYGPRPITTPATTAAAPEPVAQKKIKAVLYYVSEDGTSLVATEREVPLGEPVVEQARRLVEAQLGEAPPPLASAIPLGTTLRSLYVSERGDAFVDLSADVSTKHTGGALDELFTVYAIVNAITVNLPAITRVQILVEGKEVDTLAGHVDLRHPFLKSLKWVKASE